MQCTWGLKARSCPDSTIAGVRDKVACIRVLILENFTE
jgi:hypothetical protein